jgi:hypothetical protein
MQTAIASDQILTWPEKKLRVRNQFPTALWRSGSGEGRVESEAARKDER